MGDRGGGFAERIRQGHPIRRGKCYREEGITPADMRRGDAARISSRDKEEKGFLVVNRMTR